MDSCGPRHVVEAACRIDVLQADRRRYHAGARGEQAHDGLEGGGRAHRVPQRALDRVHGNLEGTRPENPPEHNRLDAVIQHGARAMGADEINVFGAHVGLGEGLAQGELEPTPFGIGRGDVRAIACARVPEQAAESRRTGICVARHGDKGRALPEEQAAATPIEWPHSIAGERPQSIEATHDEAAQCVVTTGDHEIGAVVAEQIGTDPDGRGSCGTGAPHGESRYLAPRKRANARAGVS